MTHTIYAVTLMLFVTTNSVNAAQPQTKARTAQEKRNSDASQYMRLVAALGGKMLHLNDDQEEAVEKTPKITDAATKPTDVRARL